MAYTISQVRPRDMAQIDALLAAEDLQRDRHLDYTCAMYDDNGCAIATGSCFGSTLRCLAVSHAHQGEGLLGQLVTHLVYKQHLRGNHHLFLCTKPQAAQYFRTLGFFEIARADGALVFMENRRDGFPQYLEDLAASRRSGISAALVMNANPFTYGHQYLAETAAEACDTLHLFAVSEDASLIPFDIRKRLVQAGVAHLPNVVVHDSGPYIISSATFPSYFLKEETAVIDGHARLDLSVFTRIAQTLNVTVRYVGEEPSSQVTALYNQIMAAELPKAGIACRIVPRKTAGGHPVSASAVRVCLRDGDFPALKTLVPPAVYDYFASPEAEPVLARIRQAGDVVHY